MMMKPSSLSPGDPVPRGACPQEGQGERRWPLTDQVLHSVGLFGLECSSS